MNKDNITAALHTAQLYRNRNTNKIFIWPFMVSIPMYVHVACNKIKSSHISLNKGQVKVKKNKKYNSYTTSSTYCSNFVLKMTK